MTFGGWVLVEEKAVQAQPARVAIDSLVVCAVVNAVVFGTIDEVRFGQLRGITLIRRKS